MAPEKDYNPESESNSAQEKVSVDEQEVFDSSMQALASKTGMSIRGRVDNRTKSPVK